MALYDALPDGARGVVRVSGSRSVLSEREFNAAAKHLDDLIQEFERLPYPAVRERFFDALQAVDAIHREALARLVDQLDLHGQMALLERARQDPVIRTLLVLYDLAPGDELPDLPSAESSRNFIALDQLQVAPRRPKLPAFAELGPLDQLPPGSMKDFAVGDLRVLVANVGGELFAVRDVCPGSMAPLHLGAFTPPVIVCAWHNEAYDIRTGRRVDGHPEPKLSVLPVFVSDGLIKLALERAPSAIRLDP